jgi:hypothetical protein
VKHAVEVDEITIPSPDFPNGQTFGPVTLERGHEDPGRELPVTFALQRRRRFGVDWYPQIYHARGVFNVNRNRITLALTDAPMVIERATWWRRFGFWLLARPQRASTGTVDAHSRLSRR